MGLAADIGIAFNDPKKLKDRGRDYEDALGLRESVEEAVTNSADLLKLVEETDRIAQQAAET